MPVSGSRDFIQTRDDIIKAALRKIRAIRQGEQPKPEQTAEAAHALNSMVQSWQSDGVFLWTVAETVQPWSENTTSYTINSNNVLSIDNIFFRSDNIDHPITIMEEDEYTSIPNKSMSGIPSKVLVRKTLTSYSIYIYPVPINSGILRYNAVTRLQDFDMALDNPDFPVEWSDALIWGLAHTLAPEYGVDINYTSYLFKMSENYKAKALAMSGISGDLFIAPFLGGR